MLTWFRNEPKLIRVVIMTALVSLILTALVSLILSTIKS